VSVARRRGMRAVGTLPGWCGDSGWAEHSGVSMPGLIPCLAALAAACCFRAVRCVLLFSLMALMQ